MAEESVPMGPSLDQLNAGVAANPMPAPNAAPASAAPSMTPPNVPNPAPAPGPAGTQTPPNPSPTQVGGGAQPKPPAGSTFHHMAQAFMGAVLGTLAGKEETTGYTTDANGQLQRQTKDISNSPKDQIARIAKGALQGLASVGQYGVAAPAVQIEKSRIHTQQQKQEATAQFEREQRAQFSQLNNTHIMLQTLMARKQLAAADLQSNESMAGLGNDIMQAAVTGGNQIVGKPNMDSDEAAAFRKDHPEYLKYTPLVTRAVLETDADGNPVLDPKTGVQKVQRSYTFVDLQKPIKLTQSMIDHLQTINYPGADRLTPDTEVDPLAFQALYYNGLKAYNEANNDAKNNEIVESSDEDGNIRKYAVNKVTHVTTPLYAGDGKPLGGQIKTEIHTIYNPLNQKNEDWLVNTHNGDKLHLVGENKSDMNSPTNILGDFTKTGEPFLNTIPPQQRPLVRSVAHYTMSAADLGRSQNKAALLSEAGQYNGGELDEYLYKTRQNYIEEYQSGKTGDGLIRSAGNTAIRHLNQLADAGQYLAQNNVRALNAIANEWGVQTGDDAKIVYDAIALKAAGEAARAVKGGEPDESQIKLLYQQMGSSASPQQREGTIKAQYNLLMAPLEVLRGRFTQNMGQTPDQLARPIIDPTNMDILRKWMPNSTVVTPSTTNTGNVGAGGIPGVPSDAHLWIVSGNIVGWSMSPDGKGDYKPLDKPVPVPQGAK